MGEPLKKEDFIRGVIVNADEYTEEKMIALNKIDAVWINLENLQSAVEWLKEILKKDLEIQLKAKRKGQAVKLDFALHLIDEAFEDVTDNSGKKTRR